MLFSPNNSSSSRPLMIFKEVQADHPRFTCVSLHPPRLLFLTPPPAPTHIQSLSLSSLLFRLLVLVICSHPRVFLPSAPSLSLSLGGQAFIGKTTGSGEFMERLLGQQTHTHTPTVFLFPFLTGRLLFSLSVATVKPFCCLNRSSCRAV